jgi:hypothetical protein
MEVKVTTYALRMNSGWGNTCATLADALEWAATLGCHSHYLCDDGRVFVYRDDAERDADISGGGERGAIEEIEEIEEISTSCSVCDRPYSFEFGCDCNL